MDEVDPELVLVFDLAGTVKDFQNAIERVEGLEFLVELLEDDAEPDDDFHMIDRETGRTDSTVRDSLYLVMSNAEAAQQLLRLFEAWQSDPEMEFARGLARFRAAFDQLRGIRHWGAADRVRDTGILDVWREHLEVVGQSANFSRVEVELWYRRDPVRRRAAEEHVSDVVRTSGGQVVSTADIAAINYHSVLIDLPAQEVERVLRDGADAIQLLTTDDVMFVNPFRPMSVAPPALSDQPTPEGASLAGITLGLPRVALLDGLPFANHDALAGRLSIDDPDDLGSAYPVSGRHHGSSMASLIIHGDLSAPGDPLDRQLYVRPVLRPHEFVPDFEQALPDRLLTDLIHQAIRRIKEGEGGRPALAPSVRIVNLSIGAEARALVRRISPLGRLLDWLSVEYNLLFIVSAGNHSIPLSIHADGVASVGAARDLALGASRSSSRLRGILPPGDSLNALTIGSIHEDKAGDVEVPDTVWDITHPGLPALYGAVGPGVGRSIKPDLYHSGGRALFLRPVVEEGNDQVQLQLANTSAAGPGTLTAAPGRAGATNATAFSHGTSNATALVTREASRLFDVLEAAPSNEGLEPPDPQFHPVIAKALLVHASSWGTSARLLRQALALDPQHAKRELTALLGYGSLDVSRLGLASTNRAVLVAGGAIGRDGRHTYQIPLPESLRARHAWHRVTVTLAFMAPAAGQLNRYRGAKVFFEKPSDAITGGSRLEAEFRAVRRGTCQHEIFDGDRAMIFSSGSSLPIDVQCMDDAQRLRSGKTIRYGLVVSVETAIETSTTVYDEVRAALQTRARARAQQQVTR